MKIDKNFIVHKVLPYVVVAASIVMSFGIGFAIDNTHIIKGNEVIDEWSATDTFDTEKHITLIKKPKEHDFTILNFADTHFKNGIKADINRKKIQNQMDKLIEKVNPDLITLTGDNIVGGSNRLAFEQYVSFMESTEKMWAPAIGNHDDEGNCSNEYMSDKYENAKHCLYKRGPTNIGSLGNYVLCLQNADTSKIEDVIYIFNNGDQPFTNGQKEWFSYIADNIANMNSGIYPNSLCIFHRPLPEYIDAYNKWEEDNFNPSYGSGIRHEDECITSENDDFFTLAKEKGVKSILVGHDHVNTYVIEYEGITLSYGLKTGVNSYYFNEKNEFINGGTTVTFKNNKCEFNHLFAEI